MDLSSTKFACAHLAGFSLALLVPGHPCRLDARRLRRRDPARLSLKRFDVSRGDGPPRRRASRS
jgi:hypothetical protein